MKKTDYLKEAAMFTDLLKNMKVKEEALSDKDNREQSLLVLNEIELEHHNSDQGKRRDSTIKKKHNTQVVPTQRNSKLDINYKTNDDAEVNLCKMPEVYLTEEAPDINIDVK